MESSCERQSIKNKPKSEKADSMRLPATNLSDLSEVVRTSPMMNAPGKPYIAQYIPPATMPPQAEPLAQYLARRDLVSSGLYQFDNKPENYRSWYSSFTSAAHEVHLTATQELDLMTKWLGKESGEMVKWIRSVHVSNPNFALHKAWERLHECYMLHQKSTKGHCFSDWTVFLGFQLKTTPNYVNSGICLWKSKVPKMVVISQVCHTLTLHVESHQS